MEKNNEVSRGVGMSEGKKYKIKYQVTFGEFLKDDIEGEGAGGCDEIMITSIIRENGATSHVFFGAGEKGMMTDLEMFKAWVLLASRLSESETLNTKLKEIAAETFEEIQGMILENKLAALSGKK